MIIITLNLDCLIKTKSNIICCMAIYGYQSSWCLFGKFPPVRRNQKRKSMNSFISYKVPFAAASDTSSIHPMVFIISSLWSRPTLSEIFGLWWSIFYDRASSGVTHVSRRQSADKQYTTAAVYKWDGTACDERRRRYGSFQYVQISVWENRGVFIKIIIKGWW